MGSALAQRLAAGLARVEAQHRLRRRDVRGGAQGVQCCIDGQPYLNFTSNDYLGLAAHPRVVARVSHELGRQGFGSGSAALLSGRSSLHDELERALADYTGMPAALLFSSGYLANLGALGGLLERGDLVVHDRLNHASLIDGVLASGAHHRRYPHADVSRAGASLAEQSDGLRWLVTESVFSMDGDVAPLAALESVATEHGATLYVDDAHGFGVLNDGRGAAASMAANSRRSMVLVMTLGKCLGSIGGVVLGSADLVQYLVQHARTYVYDTALPAVCAAAALEALAMLREAPQRVTRLHDRVARFRTRAAAAGLQLSDSQTPIQPVMIGDDARALAVAARLLAEGFYVRAIRPPTVPAGTARLRITLTHDHEDAHIDALVDALAPALNA
ncbi:MAG: 8-amino-7-oxononanoate synthase [Gammaproteobacteria bacterium]